MNRKTNQELSVMIDKAAAGDQAALESVILSVQDLVFNLSLRMLGTFSDAEDATQDILLKLITHLPSFKKESAFSTWVFRIATNYLINYQKHMFANAPLSFEYYGADIANGSIHDVPDLTQEVDKSILAEELKMSCTNVMLQCLDKESRMIFVLGTMFKVDSRMAGEILDMSPEAYRKRLSRIRGKMAGFLSSYCGEYGNGTCRCRERINYAIQSQRLRPDGLDYTGTAVVPEEKILIFKNAMEEIDDLSGYFSFCKAYEMPEKIRQFFREFLSSKALSAVKEL